MEHLGQKLRFKLIVARYGGAAGSSNTAWFIFWRSSPEPAGVTKNEKWDGSSWTEVGDMNQAKVYHAGCGTSTSALAFGGQSSTNWLTMKLGMELLGQNLQI